MANKDAPFGFKAIGGMGSSYESQGTSRYEINDNWTNAIYQGDLVGAGDGSAADRASTTSVKGYIFGSIAATTLNLGVFNGCYYIDPTTSKPTWKNYYPGAVNITTGTIAAYCYDNPQQLYEVQTSGTLDQTDVGSLIDQDTYAAGSSIDGLSNVEIGGTSKVTTGQVRIVRVTGDPSNNDTGSANSNWVVRLNESIYYDSAILS
jgi:hypothetical protein|tara:strand:+ start:38 stop:652 length:615 start_codon:yes stop_codon:yes gene_type:complete